MSPPLGPRDEKPVDAGETRSHQQALGGNQDGGAKHPCRATVARIPAPAPSTITASSAAITANSGGRPRKPRTWLPFSSSSSEQVCGNAPQLLLRPATMPVII